MLCCVGCNHPLLYTFFCTLSNLYLVSEKLAVDYTYVVFFQIRRLIG